MSRTVRVASVRFDLEHLRGDPRAPQCVFEDTARRLDELRGRQLDLVALCEGVEALGQRMEDAEEIRNPGRYLKLYTAFARAEGCHVAGSIKIREGERVSNAIVFVAPDGTVCGAYAKNNLTEGELDMGLTPGRDAAVFETAVGRLGGLICFDLNFEALRLRYRALRPDILVFASMFHGGFVQQWWAYECRAFLVTALPFNGGGIFDPLGTPLHLTDEYNPTVMATLNLDRAVIHLDHNRARFDAIRRAYGDEVEIRVPPHIGSALLISHSGERTAEDIVREYGLERLDDYFDRMRRGNGDAAAPSAARS